MFCCSMALRGMPQLLHSPLPQAADSINELYRGDWLVHRPAVNATVYTTNGGKDIVLYNGLLKRVFRLQPDIACIDYTNLVTGQQLLRSVKAEARLCIDGKTYTIGGLSGQKENAYLLPDSVDNWKKSSTGFTVQSCTVSAIQPYLHWRSALWTANRQQPTGRSVCFTYTGADTAVQGVEVKVYYDLYDGLPLLSKWLSVQNNGRRVIRLDSVVNEILGLVEEQSAVVGSVNDMEKQQGIYVETNYAFNNAMRYDLSDQTLHWKADPSYTSQVNYNLQTPCLMEVYPGRGIGITLNPGEQFRSVRSYELLMDSYDRERRGLAIRQLYRTIAPWTTANPIFMHLVSKEDAQVKAAIDQCAATGYEAVIMSFGSHCNMEDTSVANIRRWKTMADYAHSKKIALGGYSLFSSRRISDADDVIDPITGKPDAGAFFQHAPCLGSNWGLAYLAKLKYFIRSTGFDIFENDGPYPGDVCASTSHPGHKGLDDSQWRQMELQKDLYHWCNEQGVYVNAPDWYFLDGTNKIAVGYRETNYSLPREQQKILNRQNIFDGTWEKTPAMGWGFVPLTKYQGGGPEAVLEPLKDHLQDYEQLMMQYYGAGIQACYRGPRLYDADTTRETVSRVIRWYKQYRDILNADILHLRRADGRDWDGIMHVRSGTGIKAMVMLYNPLPETIRRTIRLPLYYTGLQQTALISERTATGRRYTLDHDWSVQVPVTIPANSYTWLTVE